MHSLSKRVQRTNLAERYQLRFLQLLRCDEIQGYFFSKPLPADKLASLFEPLMDADYAD